MRPERIRSLIRAALDEGAAKVEITLRSGETVRVSFAKDKAQDVNPADLVDMSE